MRIEQRANINFCFNLGKTFTETYQMMKKVYGDDCLSRSRIHEWFKRFQEGREALEDDELSGRPRNIVNEENAEIVRDNSTYANSWNRNLEYSQLRFIVF